jgi:L-fuculose-phosphate aldolase
MREAQVRERVVALARELATGGFLAATGGNIALRVDAASFAVTPSATDYYAMQAGDVSILRLADLVRIDGDRTPSVESALHARVFRHRAEVRWSIHTHQPIASACALLGEPLPVEDAGQRSLLGAQVAVVGYAPSGTAWLAAKLGKALRPGINAYLMQNHGVLCCGPELERAVEAVTALETLCAGHLQQLILARTADDVAGRQRLSAIVETLGSHASPASSLPLAERSL